MNNNVCEIYPAITKYKSSAIKEGETIAPTKNPNPESKATKAPNNTNLYIDYYHQKNNQKHKIIYNQLHLQL